MEYPMQPNPVERRDLLLTIYKNWIIFWSKYYKEIFMPKTLFTDPIKLNNLYWWKSKEIRKRYAALDSNETLKAAHDLMRLVARDKKLRFLYTDNDDKTTFVYYSPALLGPITIKISTDTCRIQICDTLPVTFQENSIAFMRAAKIYARTCDMLRQQQVNEEEAQQRADAAKAERQRIALLELAHKVRAR